METTFEKQSPTLAALTIAVGEADYAPALDKKLREYSRKAQIKGFRPGHVPIGYVKKLYGKSLMVDEVINTVSQQMNTYIRENSLRVVGDPMPNDEAMNIDWDTQKDFTFTYEVGLASDFDVDIANLAPVPVYQIQVDEARLDEAAADLRKRFGSDTNPEEAELGDMVFGTLTQESTGYSSEAAFPTDRVRESAQNYFTGLEVGSQVRFDIQSLFDNVRDLGFATTKSNEEAEALSGEFEFTVNKIVRVAPAELNQEFFDKALGEGKATNEAEFRAEIKRIMEENYARETSFLVDVEVEKALLNSTTIELPDDFLKRWLFKVNEGKFTEEDIEKDYNAFARGLRLDLIRTEIADKHKEAIEVKYEDVLEIVKEEIRNYFGGQSFPGMEEFVEKMAKERLADKKENTFREYFNKAFGRKVLAYVKSQIKTTEKPVTVEQFNEAAQAAYTF